MARQKIDIGEVVESAKKVIENDSNIAPATKIVFENLIDLVIAMSNRLSTNSSNSSKPPSQDINRVRKISHAKGQRRKQGGQHGHEGKNLQPVENPTEIEEILIDRESLPAGD